MKDIDLPAIFDAMKKNDIDELIIKFGAVNYEIRRGIYKSNQIANKLINNEQIDTGQNSTINNHQSIDQIQANIQKLKDNKNYFEVKSPLVGTFYTTPKPDSPSYVDIGSRISKGQVLCVIEAMKNFNEITSEVDGIVRELCVENGSIVEYGKILFKVEVI